MEKPKYYNDYVQYYLPNLVGSVGDRISEIKH